MGTVNDTTLQMALSLVLDILMEVTLEGKKKNGWRTHGRNGTENINHGGGYHGGSSRSCSSVFHSGQSQGLHENNIPDSETGRKEDKREHKQFEAEDFPSLNPEYDREPNQNKSLVAGVWGLHTQTHTYPTKKSPKLLS